jgi:hypothetical protein
LILIKYIPKLNVLSNLASKTMKSVVISLLAILCCACAQTSVRDTHQPHAAASAEPARMDALVVSRLNAEHANCRIVRALDGRAICATRPAPANIRQIVSVAGTAEARPRDIAQALAAGDYLVIGSFSKLENATRWARYNADFGTTVQPIAHHGATMYRVVVGPLEGANSALMRDILSVVGLDDSWQLAMYQGASELAIGQGPTIRAAHSLAHASAP